MTVARPLDPRCEDCASPSDLQLFDGRRMVGLCDVHYYARLFSQPPAFGLPAWPDRTFIIGHAAPVNVMFRHAGPDALTLFCRGSFQSLTGDVVLGVNHEVCRCGFKAGGSPAIDARGVMASTQAGTMMLSEDLFGLFFVAQLWNDAGIRYTGEDEINLVDAIRDGRCSELSVHGHGGRGLETLPWARTSERDCAFTSYNLVEVSLLIRAGVGHEGKGGAPGTWVRIADAAAMSHLHAKLRRCYEERC